MWAAAQIIQVNLTSEEPRALKAGDTVELTYSVVWVPTDITFTRRFERYLDYNFFEHQVRAASPQLLVVSLPSPMHEMAELQCCAYPVSVDIIYVMVCSQA